MRNVSLLLIFTLIMGCNYQASDTETSQGTKPNCCCELPSITDVVSSSLYDRLGGKEGIKNIVSATTKEMDIQEAKFHSQLLEQIETIAKTKDARNSQLLVKLDCNNFDSFLGHLRKGLEKTKVDQATQDELLEILSKNTQEEKQKRSKEQDDSES